MKKVHWIISFFLLWLALSISTIPANWAIYIVQKILPNWQVDNISGNFWQGSAQENQLLIDNKTLSLGQLKWQINPLGLLQLKPCVKFSTHLQRQTLLAHACFSLISRELQLRDSELAIDVNVLEPWLIMRLKGDADITLKSIIIKDKHFYNIDGTITWRKAQFHNSQTWVNLGELQAYLIDDNASGLRSQLTDTKGPLAVNLTVHMPKKGGLRVSGEVTPKATAQAVVHETLQIIGKSNNQGGYTIDWDNR